MISAARPTQNARVGFLGLDLETYAALHGVAVPYPDTRDYDVAFGSIVPAAGEPGRWFLVDDAYVFVREA